jgi:hypothetical protein
VNNTPQPVEFQPRHPAQHWQRRNSPDRGIPGPPRLRRTPPRPRGDPPPPRLPGGALRRASVQTPFLGFPEPGLEAGRPAGPPLHAPGWPQRGDPESAPRWLRLQPPARTEPPTPEEITRIWHSLAAFAASKPSTWIICDTAGRAPGPWSNMTSLSQAFASLTACGNVATMGCAH